MKLGRSYGVGEKLYSLGGVKTLGRSLGGAMGFEKNYGDGNDCYTVRLFINTAHRVN